MEPSVVRLGIVAVTGAVQRERGAPPERCTSASGPELGQPECESTAGSQNVTWQLGLRCYARLA